MTLSRLDRPTLAFLGVLAALLCLRVWALTATQLELQFDEAQYWFWSRTLDWGYFSKPPLIAWTIAATTALFGNAEWAVRLSAPLSQGAAAAALFLLARRLYGPSAGFWAGFGWLITPAVWLSSSVMSTDALLMPLWSLGLLALWRLHETRAWRWAIVLGAAIGFGALAKYAMLYFVLCAALAALWAPALRQTLLSRQGLAASLVAAAVLAPNLAWNAAHRFATISHTAANAGGAGFGFNPDEVVEFLSGQMLMVGPGLFALLAYLGWRVARRPAEADIRERYLIAFFAPPLVIIVGQALLSHAHANWAATAYPAALVWLAGRFSSGVWGPRILAGAAALNIALGAITVTATLNQRFANDIGLANAVEDSRGWRETARRAAAQAQALGGVTAIMTDHRALFFELTYYWPDAEGAARPPLRMWMLHEDARNHAEASAPMRPQDGARTLVVHMQRRYVDVVTDDFAAFRELSAVELELGGGETRWLQFSLGEGFAPAPRDAAFLARVGE